MSKSFKWSFGDAVSVIRKTYAEDWGKAQKERDDFLQENTDISEIKHANITGLQAGEGPAVVFIHGSPANAMRWSQYLKSVPEGYYFISIDRMGFGERGMTLSHLENDFALIKDFISELDNPIVVAHSLGGAIALRLANEIKMKRLILIASSLDPSMERILKIQQLGNLPILSKVLSLSIRHSNHEMLQLPDFMLNTEKRLKKIETPCVVIHPKDDKLVSCENVTYAQRYLTNLKIITPDTGGHFIPWTHPDLIMEAITGGKYG